MFEVFAAVVAFIILGFWFYIGVVVGRALAPDQECHRKHRDEL